MSLSNIYAQDCTNEYSNQKKIYNNINKCQSYIQENFSRDDNNIIFFDDFLGDIYNGNSFSYENIKSKISIFDKNKEKGFSNVKEFSQNFQLGLGKDELSSFWGINGIIWENKNIFIGPNIEFIYPYKSISTNKKLVPIFVYVNDNQLPNETNLELTLYVVKKDLGIVGTEDGLRELINSNNNNGGYKIFDVKNKRISKNIINIDEIRGDDEEGNLYIYVVAKNIYGNKSKIIKSSLSYNRTTLRAILGYTEQYKEYNNKYWTNNPNVNFLNLYTNLKPKRIQLIKNPNGSGEEQVTLGEIVLGNYSKDNKLYKYKSKLYLYNLKEGCSVLKFKITDIYNNTKELSKEVCVDSKGPEIIKKDIKTNFYVLHQGKKYLKPKEYQENNGFNIILNIKDKATKTEKVIVKTDLGKKIILDLEDGVDYELEKILTSFDNNGEKILEIEAYDVFGNISKEILNYNILNYSYPIITYTPTDNLIVVGDLINFQGYCTGVNEAKVKVKLNDDAESDWVDFQDNWEFSKILKRGYNIFKVKCKNIVGESDWVERVVIYEKKENVGGRNSQLEMYPSKSKKFKVFRSNKNADNDTLKIVNPTLYKEVPGFQN